MKNNIDRTWWQFLKLGAIASVVTTLAVGCGVQPIKLNQAAFNSRAALTLNEVFANQEPLNGSISLGEAMARALMYNLDDRVRLMEMAVEEGLVEVENLNLLPSLAMNAGYSAKDRDTGSFSKNLSTGVVSTTPTTSTEKNVSDMSLEMAWNVLDFGISYANAQQQADRSLIAEERRRQTIQNILADVRLAFWRAYAAQIVRPEVNAMVEQVQQALADTGKTEASGLVSRAGLLKTQAELLDTMQKLFGIRRELDVARNELAGLMNVKPGTEFTLVSSRDPLTLPGSISLDAELVEGLEFSALLNRRELRIADYNVRIQQQEVRKALLSVLPSPSVNLGFNYSGNDLLVHSNHVGLTLGVLANLFEILNYPKRKALADARVELEETKRLATSVAVLTQVHVSLARYHMVHKQFDYAIKLQQVDQELLKGSEASLRSGVASRTDAIASRLNAMQSLLNSYMLHADVQNAISSVYQSVSIDFTPEVISSEMLGDLREFMDSRVSYLANPAPSVQQMAQAGLAVLKDAEGESLAASAEEAAGEGAGSELAQSSSPGPSSGPSPDEAALSLGLDLQPVDPDQQPLPPADAPAVNGDVVGAGVEEVAGAVIHVSLRSAETGVE